METEFRRSYKYKGYWGKALGRTQLVLELTLAMTIILAPLLVSIILGIVLDELWPILICISYIIYGPFIAAPILEWSSKRHG